GALTALRLHQRQPPLFPDRRAAFGAPLALRQLLQDRSHRRPGLQSSAPRNRTMPKLRIPLRGFLILKNRFAIVRCRLQAFLDNESIFTLKKDVVEAVSLRSKMAF